MKKKIKDIKNICIGLVIGITITATPVFADSILTKIDVVLNGINVQLEGQNVEVDSILYNGITYLPMRKVIELVEKDIEWNQQTMTVNIIKKTDKIDDNKFPIIEKEDNMDEESNTIIKSNKLTNDGFIVYTINDKDYVNPDDFYKKYNKFEEFEIQFFLSKGGLIENSNEPVDMYINGEIALKSIKSINTTKTIHPKLYIEVDYYENTILPLISK